MENKQQTELLRLIRRLFTDKELRENKYITEILYNDIDESIVMLKQPEPRGVKCGLLTNKNNENIFYVFKKCLEFLSKYQLHFRNFNLDSKWFKTMDDYIIIANYLQNDNIIERIKTSLIKKIENIDIASFNLFLTENNIKPIWNHVDFVLNSAEDRKNIYRWVIKNPVFSSFIKENVNNYELNDDLFLNPKLSEIIDITEVKEIPNEIFSNQTQMEYIYKKIIKKGEKFLNIDNLDYQVWNMLVANKGAAEILEAKIEDYIDEENEDAEETDTLIRNGIFYFWEKSVHNQFNEFNNIINDDDFDGEIELLTNLWERICLNPAAVNIITDEDNRDKIIWEYLCLNPCSEAVEMCVSRYRETGEISISHLSSNPYALNFIRELLNTADDDIKDEIVDGLCNNKSKQGIELLKEIVGERLESNKVNWKYLCRNPYCIDICREKIEAGLLSRDLMVKNFCYNTYDYQKEKLEFLQKYFLSDLGLDLN